MSKHTKEDGIDVHVLSQVTNVSVGRVANRCVGEPTMTSCHCCRL